MSKETKVLDYGYCKLIEAWGSDEDVIRAARMSTDGAFRGWGPIHEPWCEQHKHEYHSDETCKVKAGDEKLLRYLWKNRHYSPFEFGGLVVEAQLPIFVAREWVRHRTWNFNELSARYSTMPDLHYVPSIERIMAGKQGQSNKQGSEAGFSTEAAGALQTVFIDTQGQARLEYESLLRAGVARELARIVLPLGQYTRWRASANLRNILYFLELRMASNSQWEIQQYANAIAELVKERFPRTYDLFSEERNANN